MKCPQCNEENIETAKFCKGCGRSLAMIPSSGSSDSFVNKYKKQIGAVALLAAVFVGGMLFQNNRSESNDNSVGTELPVDKEDIKVPREAKEFIDQYTILHNDTEMAVSTYYADQALEKEYGRSFVLSEEYISNPNRSITELKFQQLRYPVDAQVSSKESIEIWNTYTSEMLDLYANYINKNRYDTRAVEIIDEAFEMSISNSMNQGTKLEVTEDNEDAQALMDFVKTIIYKDNNTAANYKFNKAKGSNDPTQNSADTIFWEYEPITPGTRKDSYREYRAWGDGGTIIGYTTSIFEGKDVSSKNSQVKNVQINYLQMPPYPDEAVSQISIGIE